MSLRPRTRLDNILVAVSAVLLLLLGVVVLTSGNDEQTTAGSGQNGDSGDGSSGASQSEKPDPNKPNFEITKLAAGEQPPQFILFSFDGSGSTEKWKTFSAAAKKVDARFTGFLTGTYLVPDDAKTEYQGPGHAPGKSSVGFGGTPEEVAATVKALNEGRAAGHEIGTHYNGHFCAGAEPSGKDWSTEQWNSELDQFFHFINAYPTIGSVPGPKLSFTAADIRGGRTPCLEGTPEKLFPALVAHGLTYDTSLVSNGIVWPKLIDGIWEFYMPTVRIPSTDQKVIAMDYNFWYKFNQAKENPGAAAQWTATIVETYHSMLDASLAGNRAPLVIGNHFNNWSGNAFNPAVEQFMLEACGEEGVVCTTYQHVLEWMAAQDPAVLQTLLDSPPTFN